MGLAICIDFSSSPRSINADAVVVYLVSLLKWTPFYWGQDRFGMFTPLLAWPIQNPVANVFFQDFLHLCGVFAVVFLWARVLDFTNYVLCGVLTLLSFFVVTSRTNMHEYLAVSQIYSTAMVFGLVSLRLSPKQPWLGTLAALLSGWCNFAVPFFLGLWIGWLAVFNRKLPTWTVLAILLGTSGGWLIGIPYRTHESQGYNLAGSFQLLNGFARLFGNLFSSQPLVMTLPLGILVLACVIGRSHFKRVFKNRWREYVAAVSAILTYLVLVASSQLAEWAGYPTRYWIPCVLLWLSLNIGLSVEIILECLKEKKFFSSPRAVLVSAFCLAIAVCMRFGLPSISAAKTEMARALELHGRDPLSLRCTHVVGDYYRIWPAVLYARLQGHEIWAVGNRSMETRENYSLDHFSTPRICVWKDDLQEAGTAMNMNSLKAIEESQTMYVLGP
jgi:hypothetical protein